MAPAIKLLTSPTTDLERLHADRAGLARELATLQASNARLNQATSAEASALAELSTLADGEVEEMKAWAGRACVGPVPEVDAKLRRAAAEKLASAQHAAAAARAAGSDIDYQIAQLSERQRSISDEINLSVFDLVGHEHDDVIREYTLVCERAGRLAAKISGLAMYYRDAGNLQQASVIAATKLPNPGTNRLEIMAAADMWSRRIAALRSGAAQ